MMKPRGASAWWTASLVTGLLASGLAWGGFSPLEPMGMLVIALALVAIGCAAMAVRTRRAA